MQAVCFRSHWPGGVPPLPRPGVGSGGNRKFSLPGQLKATPGAFFMRFGSCLILSRQSGLLIFTVPHAGPCVQAQPAAGMVSPFSKRARTSNTSSRLLFAMSPQTAPFFTAVRRRSPSA